MIVGIVELHDMFDILMFMYTVDFPDSSLQWSHVFTGFLFFGCFIRERILDINIRKDQTMYSCIKTADESSQLMQPRCRQFLLSCLLQTT